MRSHHKSYLISSWHENNNSSQCWFANVTIRKGETNSIATAAAQDQSSLQLLEHPLQ
jgi:hypothetical protein